MAYLNLSNDYYINTSKNIGKVIYIVEGEGAEFDIIYKLFTKLLGYNLIQKRRSKDKVRCFVSKDNSNSIVYVINSINSNIKSIISNPTISLEEYYNSTFDLINRSISNYDYKVDAFNSRKYFLFDGDRPEDMQQCKDIIIKLFEKFNNSFGTDDDSDFEMGGMLLVSYPCIEILLMSLFTQNDYNKDFGPIKDYCSKNGYATNKIKNFSCINSLVDKFINQLNSIDINSIDIDDISIFNKKILKYEESNDYNFFISMFCLSLIDLGIIELKS